MSNTIRSLFAAALFAVTSLSFAGPVNVNSADAKTIAKELHGIGNGKAQLIVAYRDSHGPFTSADQLRQIKGIGKKTIEKNREFILLQDD